MMNDDWLLTYAYYDKELNDPKGDVTKLKMTSFKKLDLNNQNFKCRAYLNTSGIRITKHTKELYKIDDLYKNIWNNVTYEDVDYKRWYHRTDECIKEDPKILFRFIMDWMIKNYSHNICDGEISRHGEGFHFYFKWDCEQNERNRNYYKAVGHAIVYKAFCELGWKDIIEYNGKDGKVFDDCTDSYFQTVYPTKNNWIHNNKCDGKITDYSDLNINYNFDKKISDEKRNKVIKEILGNTKNYNKNKYEIVFEGMLDDVKYVDYIEHHKRWELFESLYCIFNDEIELKKQWNRCARMIPEMKEHTTDFYINEPYKNNESYSWIQIAKEKLNDDFFIDITLLRKFGYDVYIKKKHKDPNDVLKLIFG